MAGRRRRVRRASRGLVAALCVGIYALLLALAWIANHAAYRGLPCRVTNASARPAQDVIVFTGDGAIALRFARIGPGESAMGRILPPAAPALYFRRGAECGAGSSGRAIPPFSQGWINAELREGEVVWGASVTGRSLAGMVSGHALGFLVTPVWVPFLMWDSFRKSIL